MAPPAARFVIKARRANNDFIEVHVLNSGPGFSLERIEIGILPLSSSKPYGLGVGLSLCRSIVDAHAGRLWLEPRDHGAFDPLYVTDRKVAE